MKERHAENRQSCIVTETYVLSNSLLPVSAKVKFNRVGIVQETAAGNSR
jgi:hypothetical protein